MRGKKTFHTFFLIGRYDKRKILCYMDMIWVAGPDCLLHTFTVHINYKFCLSAFHQQYGRAMSVVRAGISDFFVIYLKTSNYFDDLSFFLSLHNYNETSSALIGVPT